MATNLIYFVITMAITAEAAEIKANMQKLSDNIDYIKEHTTKNEDFIRVMTRLENKIDQLRSD